MRYFSFLLLAFFLIGCKNDVKKTEEAATSMEQEVEVTPEADETSLIFPGEEHFKSLRQVTFGGDNAEAYWSFDDRQLIFQSNYSGWGADCDQMFLMNFDDNFQDSKPPLLSTGLGRTTCGYFLPDNKHVLYASTHLGGDACPPEPERTSDKYVWPIYDSYEIFTADLEGNLVTQLTDTPGYNAEATVSPKGDRIVFTSTRTGDLELFTMNIDGSDVKQITNQVGYDGGAFFSPDGTKLVFRAYHPQTEEEIKEYKDLLVQGLVQPTKMEIFVCNADGSDLRQVTNLGNANWAPFFHPSGEKIIFASNHESKRGYPFHLYLIDIDGSNLKRITNSGTFDAFPVFSNDGKYLAFSSNRNNGGGHDTNVFIAEWKE